MHEPTITKPSSVGGEQRIYEFPNGYGASVVRNQYTYGGKGGLWELAVLDSAGALTYETPITQDVIGWLTEEDVQETLDRIAALTPESIAQASAEHKLTSVITAEEFIAWMRPEVEVEAGFTEDNSETLTLADYIADLSTRLERILAGEYPEFLD